MFSWFTRKRIIIIIIAAVVLGFIGMSIVRGRNGAANVITDTVKSQNLQRTVLATGQVTSSTDIDLNFKNSGLVAKVNVKVGQEVKAGDILANLTQREESAAVTQARGSLAQAQANYRKVIAGADTPEVNVAKAAVKAAETTLQNAKLTYNATAFQQDTLVNNARKTLYSSGLEAQRSVYDADDATVTVSGLYNGTEEGFYKFDMYASTGGYQLQYWGLETGKGTVIKRGVPIPLGTKGLYITFSNTGSMGAGRTWTVNIPNVKSSTYVTNKATYDAAVRARDEALIAAQNTVNTAQSSLEQSQSSLAEVARAARPEDIAVAQAQVLSAQGSLEAAAAQLENTVIRAPANGTITAVEVKVGEQASSTEPAIVLKDIGNLYVEANISEANVSGIQAGQDVEFTFDAIPNQTFKGKVVLIDPASTLVSGVVNYKLTASVEKVDLIKPGMTANLRVITATKPNVLTVPERALITRDGAQFIRVIIDTKKKTYEERNITIGLKGDGGQVEVLTGLKAAEEIVSDIKE